MTHQQFVFILCIYTSLTVLVCVSAQIHEFNKNDTNIRILPAYAIASRAELLNSTTCRKELENFKDALDQRILWSLKILDSSGNPKSGFLFGNNYWLASPHQCFDTTYTAPLQIPKRDILNNTLYRNPQEEFPPFEVNYFVAYFRHNSTLQYHVNVANEDLIMLGLCLPASCTLNELSLILEKIFHDRVLLFGDLYSMDFKLIKVKDLQDSYQWPFSGAALIIYVVLALTFSMMLIGTIYDIFVHQKYFNGTNKTIPSMQNIQEEVETAVSYSCQESTIGKVLKCFSVYTNTKIIFSTKSESDTISIIHGLRFLSMSYIILVHSLLFIVDYLENIIWMWKISETIPIQILSNSSFSVDTFLFQSGFLVSYLYLKSKKDKERLKRTNYKAKINEFFIYIIRRFLRLTPAYMMTIAILQLNFFWNNEASQFYINETLQENCRKYWWKNLLYINNLSPQSKMCMTWTWYLSTDMQYFIITMILLILSTIYFYVAISILGILLISSTVLCGYTSYIYEFIPTLSDQYKFVDVFYYPPWFRISPYIIGVFTAYILIKLNNKLVLKRRTVILCWCFGSVGNLLVLFGLYNRQISVLTNVFYITFSRIVWTIGIAWIIIACITNHGGIVNQILTFRGWIPLSRLTYCAYLLNPVVIHSTRMYNEVPLQISGLMDVAVTFVGYFVITFFCAYILSLMAEAPYILLMRMFVKSYTKKEYRSHEIVITHTKM